MVMKPVVESLDSVDEKFRGEYVPEKGPENQETGRFILAVDSQDGYEVVNTSGYRKTLDTLRGEIKEHKNTLSQFEGIDPTTYKETVEELQRFKEADPEKEEHINEQVAQRTEAAQAKMQQQLETFKTEAEKRQNETIAERDKFKGMLTQVSVVEKAHVLAAKVSASPDLLAPHIMPFLKLNTEGKTPVLEVVDANGTPRSGKDFSTPMTTDELLEEISNEPKFSPLIKAPTNSGPGNEPPSKNKFGSLPKPYDPKAPIEERVAAIAARSK